MKELVRACLIAGTLSVFFYRSFFAFVPMLLPAFISMWWERKKQIQEKQEILLQQFEECILSVCSCVRSGYAAENAFVESMKDMELIYGKNAAILKELRIIKGGLESRNSLEQLLFEMGNRTQLREIKEFAEVFAIAKQNGANMSEVIKSTAGQISADRYLKEEMKTILASKILEGRIMNYIPFFLMTYVECTTPGYFAVFYGNTRGVLLMTVFLIWYMGAYAFTEAILWKLKRD